MAYKRKVLYFVFWIGAFAAFTAAHLLYYDNSLVDRGVKDLSDHIEDLIQTFDSMKRIGIPYLFI